MIRALSYILTLYAGAGLFAGLLMSVAIPLNVLGVAYIGATWPVQIYCAPKSRECDPMPRTEIAQYLFKSSIFEDQTQ